MSIQVTRALFCDRCANWFAGALGDLATTVRRNARERQGWARVDGVDLCPDHATPSAPEEDQP